MRVFVCVATARNSAAVALFTLAAAFAVGVYAAGGPASSPPRALKAASGIPVIATLQLPPGFVAAGLAPLWFQDGEVAVIGHRADRLTILGYSGLHFEHTNLIAADGGPGAKHGAIWDLALSPDKTALALAVGSDDGIDVIVRNVLSNSPPDDVEGVDGHFSAAAIGWLDSSTIALGVRAALRPKPPGETEPSAAEDAVGQSGLYTVKLHDAKELERIALDCLRAIDFAHIAWSPDGRHAIADSDTPPPVLVDRIDKKCRDLYIAPGQRIHVLGWTPKGNRFLYLATALDGTGLPGVFEYDISRAASRPIAAPAAAATYLRDGGVLVLGNRRLTLGLLENRPDTLVDAEVALTDSSGAQVRIVPLGFLTSAALLLNGSLASSQIGDAIAVELFYPRSGEQVPIILSFDLSRMTTRALASGRAGSTLSMSWSPNGDLLALLDYSANPPVLTILSPPH